MSERDGMYVKIEAVHLGLHPAMAIVDILTADGRIAQFEMSDRAIVHGRTSVGWPVGYRDDALLIEITTQPGCLSGGPNLGSHRVWVPRASLVRGEEMEGDDADR